MRMYIIPTGKIFEAILALELQGHELICLHAGSIWVTVGLTDEQNKILNDRGIHTQLDR